MESADCASFFSLIRTFSFPGITMYSVSKSFSTSTPRSLLGRLFTWAREASTVYPVPRYFWMVFALAGDSTMTKPLDNGSSVRVVLELKLARMSERQQLRESQLSVLSYQLSVNRLHFLHQGRQHSFHLYQLICKTLVAGIPQVVQVMSD